LLWGYDFSKKMDDKSQLYKLKEDITYL
jgi:hypothetical protein